MSTTNTDHGFKLLAIRPLKGCDPKYSKNLELGRIYQFYKDYTITPEIDLDGTKPVSISHTQTIPEDLYDIITAKGKPINVNISAIVGKNGSGKSALLELFFGLIYVLAETEGLLVEDGIQSLKKQKQRLEEIRDEINRLTFDPNSWLKSKKKEFERIMAVTDTKPEDKVNEVKKLFNSQPIHLNPENQITHIEKRLSALNRFLRELKAEVFFEINGNHYKLTTSCSGYNKRIGIFDIQQKSWYTDKKLNHFFYSVAVNYSIHGLNARHIGEWINPLFHKNDAYQTPLVINPMRINGDIDINNEEYLAKSRLLSNILSKSGKAYNLALTESQEAHHFTFRIIEGKTDIVFEKETRATANPRIPVSFEEFYENHVVPSKKDNEKRLFQKIYSILFDLDLKMDQIENQFGNVKYHDSVKKYILKKLVKIARKEAYKYDDYFKGLSRKIDSSKSTYRILDCFSLEDRNDENGNPIPSLFEEYLNSLKKDRSHITLKLRQAINYLKNDPLSNEIVPNRPDERIWTQIADRNIPSIKFKGYQIDAKILVDRLNNFVTSNTELNELLPPSLFDVDIELENMRTNKMSSFNQLSSGEQQHIHSIHSILYHLNNLNSVFKKAKAPERQTYPHINIMLDEIELYFHPDFQRKFITDLLSGIKRLNIGGKNRDNEPIGIQSINILFATHSPFILSDIPSQNVLRLENGLPPTKEQKGTFGANVHDLLHDSFFLNDGFMGKFAEEKIKSVIDFLTGPHNKTKLWDIDSAEKFIQLIDEPFLKGDLIDLLKAKKSKMIQVKKMTNKEIDLEIQRLQQLKTPKKSKK